MLILATGQVATRGEFEAALKALAKKEKVAQRTLDELAAQLRELPMVKIEMSYKLPVLFSQL